MFVMHALSLHPLEQFSKMAHALCIHKSTCKPESEHFRTPSVHCAVGGFCAGTFTVTRFEHPENAPLPILVALGALTVVKPVHPAKAESPMIVTFGTLADAKFVHPEKAPLPIDVKLGN